jgi:hypothetical protein
MPNPRHPEVPFDPGDAGILRGIDVRTVTLHRTIGFWSNDFSLGKHRSHDEGTFQFLIGQDPGQWAQFFAVNTFSSHAAGSNEVGPGIEISGQNGEPLTDWQIDALGRIMRWLRDEWGIAETFAEGDPRVQYDLVGPSGFVCHNNVFHPNPKLIHHDFITRDEWTRAFGASSQSREDRMKPGLFIDPTGVVYVYDPNNHTKTRVDGPATLTAIQDLRKLEGLPTDTQRSPTTDALLKGAVELK